MFKPTIVTSKLSNRERLRASLAARDAALQAVIDARETLERLQAVIDQARNAAKAATAATHAASEARKNWVRNGCHHSECRELQRLDDAATDASRGSERGARDAADAQKELARAEDAIKSRRFAVSYAEDAITGAVGVIIAAEAAPLLARFERAAEEYRNLRAQVIGVRLILEQPWSLATKNRMNPAYDAERLISDSLHRARIQDFDAERANARAADNLNGTHHERDWFDGLSAPWRERAKALRENPDA